MSTQRSAQKKVYLYVSEVSQNHSFSFFLIYFVSSSSLVEPIISKEENYTTGYVIGSQDGYYPITPFKTNMNCGFYNLRELAQGRTISYRYYWWENIDDFSSDMEQTLKKMNNLYCFVYVQKV